MPRWVVFSLIVLASLALIPFACIARARAVRSAQPRVHLIQDMDNQSKFKSQQLNPLFADRRSMRPPVAGTVSRGELRNDDHRYRGIVDGRWATRFPDDVDEQLLARGRERYDVYCSPCHGLAGYGDGIVARRADRLQEGTWVPPSSFHTDLVRERTVGELFNSITNGVRNMPAYGSMIPVPDRWAIVAYVRALQRSQNATLEEVPAELRSSLDKGEAAR